MDRKAEAIGRKVIKKISGAVNVAALMILLSLVTFAGYALWDAQQIYQAADKAIYAVYKPTAANEGKTFLELQALNTEVFAWLSVYGTDIDYPVTQGQDNMKYINTNAEGLYSLSGAIFLDCFNNGDFSDFNNILYGHHMEKNAMFGEIESFANGNTFSSRRYGNLYYGGKEHGLEFFAFVHTDAYDSAVFTANVTGDAARQAYLDGLLAKAVHERAIGITAQDNIVLLSTCSSASTNGRDILVGKITDELYEDTFINAETNDGHKLASAEGWDRITGSYPRWLLILIPFLIFAALVFLPLVIFNQRKQSGEEVQNI